MPLLCGSGRHFASAHRVISREESSDSFKILVATLDWVDVLGYRLSCLLQREDVAVQICQVGWFGELVVVDNPDLLLGFVADGSAGFKNRIVGYETDLLLRVVEVIGPFFGIHVTVLACADDDDRIGDLFWVELLDLLHGISAQFCCEVYPRDEDEAQYVSNFNAHERLHVLDLVTVVHDERMTGLAQSLTEVVVLVWVDRLVVTGDGIVRVDSVYVSIPWMVSQVSDDIGVGGVDSECFHTSSDT